MSHRKLRMTWLCILLAALTFQAASAEECKELLPDFKCQDRESRYEGFIPIQTMPYLNEDPFITTGATFRYVHQEYPDDSVFEGGNIEVFALQLRLAITDKLAFIATKDGYAINDPDLAIVEEDKGFFDIAAGFKYQLIDDPENQFALAPALRVEIPIGEESVYGGHHSSLLIPSLHLAKGWYDFHLLGSFGAQIGFDKKSADMLFYALQADYKVHTHFSPFIALNGTTHISDGDGSLPVETTLGTLDLSTVQDVLNDGNGFEGADVLNLGSEDVSGNTVVTAAIGFYVPIKNQIGVGLAYELPLTSRKDLIEQRVSLNFNMEF